MITAAQMRAARALLGIDQQTLADLAGVSLPTIQRMEAIQGNVRGVVAIVALPLSMAIAIGSGLPPEKGLYTAVVGGFLISALGGSRFQIGGPAGAFIVLIAAIAPSVEEAVAQYRRLQARPA